MYSSITGGGYNSDTYGVGYYSAYSGPVAVSIDVAAQNIPVSGMYITNATYSYLSMKDDAEEILLACYKFNLKHSMIPVGA